MIERDNLSEDEAKSNREPIELTERNGFADVVIDSSGTVEQTRKQVIKWLKTINV